MKEEQAKKSKRKPMVEAFYRTDCDEIKAGPFKSEDFFAGSYIESRNIEIAQLRVQADIANRSGSALFLCASCHHPLIICGGGSENKKKYHFRHCGYRPEHCEYDEGYNPRKDWKRSLFNGKQEGPEHRRIKGIICMYLGEMYGADNVHVEQRVKMPKGSWRKPDLNVDIDGRKVAIEIQLAPIGMPDIVGRNTDYCNNGFYIIWILREFKADFTKEDFWKKDICIHNFLNVFVFDEDAERATIENGELYLTVWYRDVKVDVEDAEAEWVSELCRFSELTFDAEQHLIYYKDTKTIRQQLIAVQNAKVAARKAAEEAEEAVREAVRQRHKREEEKYVEAWRAVWNADIRNEEQLAIVLSRDLDWFHKNEFFDNFPWQQIEFIREEDGCAEVFKQLCYYVIICRKLQSAEDSEINSKAKTTEESIIDYISNHNIINSLINCQCRLDVIGQNFVKDQIKHMLSKDKNMPLENENQFEYVVLLLIDDIVKKKSVTNYQSLVDFIKKNLTPLRIFFTMWTGVNVTQFPNYSAMADNIVNHHTEFTERFVAVALQMGLQSKMHSKRYNQFDRAKKTAAQRRQEGIETPNQVRAILKCLETTIISM